MKQILFSCIGTSDPVRGMHDGPMLHIVRNYRPELVYLFLTPEMANRWDSEQYLSQLDSHIRTNWDGYVPQWRKIPCEVTDAHNLDALNVPIHQAIASILQENPDVELLINLTSGTPQMQLLLSMIAMDTRYPARGIQVSNFENKAGTTVRANDKNYDIDGELELNEDNQIDAPNRCSEPELYSIHRENNRRKLIALLEQRNFDAVVQLSEEIPEELRTLVQHLVARSHLEHGTAQRLAGELKNLPFQLYAYKTGSRKEYSPVCEYYLLMRNLVEAGQYSQFLLHMEPLTLKLQLALLEKLLKAEGCSLSAFIPTEWNGKQMFDPDKLKAAHPALYAHYQKKLNLSGWTEKKTEISTYLCQDLLSFFPDRSPKAIALFEHYGQLKDLRNRLAHQLCSCTAEDIRVACGLPPEKLLKETEATIMVCYEACNPSIFTVYDDCIDYLKEKM